MRIGPIFFILLAGCAPGGPQLGVGIGIGPNGVSVNPRVTADVGGVNVSAGTGGVGVSTDLGPVSVSAGY